MSEEKSEEGLTLDKRTMDVLVANIIPTSKYFEVRFDNMQGQIDDLRGDLKDFRRDVDRRFDSAKSDMSKRFEQVDKRFEQVIASMPIRLTQNRLIPQDSRGSPDLTTRRALGHH